MTLAYLNLAGLWSESGAKVAKRIFQKPSTSNGTSHNRETPLLDCLPWIGDILAAFALNALGIISKAHESGGISWSEIKWTTLLALAAWAAGFVAAAARLRATRPQSKL